MLRTAWICVAAFNSVGRGLIHRIDGEPGRTTTEPNELVIKQPEGA